MKSEMVGVKCGTAIYLFVHTHTDSQIHIYIYTSTYCWTLTYIYSFIHSTNIYPVPIFECGTVLSTLDTLVGGKNMKVPAFKRH